MTAPAIHLVSIAAPFRFGQADMKRPPSAILYVGGYLKQHGFAVHVHHIAEDQIPDAMQAIACDPSVLFVGFSVITGAPVASSARASALLKELRPACPVVWGGIHASLLPAECLAYPFVDYVVVGEGEETALELAMHLSGQAPGAPGQIKGLAYADAGVVVINPRRPYHKDLDRYRQDWSLVDMRTYAKGDTFYFIASRGCPHRCGFCYNLQFNQRSWRAHSVDFVIAEIAEIQGQTGITQVVFDDDNFFTDVPRGLEIIRRLHERGVVCQWVEIRIDYITPAILEQLALYRTRRLFVGWESGSPETLVRITKDITVSMIVDKFRLMARFPGLGVDASAIIGFPWESRADIRRTVRLALRLFFIKPFTISFNLGQYIPYPGSAILEEAFQRGFSFPASPEGWREYDILSGTLLIPWASARTVRRYYLIDKYARMLYRPANASKKRIVLVALAVLRLFFGFFRLPLEIRREERIAKKTP